MTRVAWVTGAGSGIGREVALELAGNGWTVAGSARTQSDLERLVGDTQGLPGRAVAYPVDVTDAAEVEAIVERIETDLGPVDLAVLNAGTYIRFGAEDFDAAAFAQQLNINVMGTVNSLAPVMRAMIRRRQGRIAVISSLTAYRGLPLASAYGASKAALTNMCESLRPELENLGVYISIVHPGFVRTPLTDRNDFPMPFLMEADAAARHIVAELSGNRFEIAMPWRFVMILKLLRCLPYFLYFSVARRILK